MTTTVAYPAHIRTLKANLTQTRKAFARHRKTCHPCTVAHAVHLPDKRCDTGWAWVKDEWKWVRALERAGHPELAIDGDQLLLW